jgi:hypothetical protein
MTVHVFAIDASRLRGRLPGRYLVGSYAGPGRAPLVFWVIACDSTRVGPAPPRPAILGLIGIEIRSPLGRGPKRQGPATFDHYLLYGQSDDRGVADALRAAGLPAAWVPGMTFTRTKASSTAFVPWPPAPYRLTAHGSGFDILHNHDNSYWHESGGRLGRLEIRMYNAHDCSCGGAHCRGTGVATRAGSPLAQLLGAPRAQAFAAFDHYRIAHGSATVGYLSPRR